MDLQQIEKELAVIKERNQRVEADKAWETSSFRIGTLVVITYLTAVVVLYVIGVKYFYLGAIVPAERRIFSFNSIATTYKKVAFRDI